MAQSETAENSGGYTPDYTNTARVDATATLSHKVIEEIGLSVDHWQADDGPILELRTHDDLLTGRFLIEPDQADWLADQLRDHAEAARSE